MPPHTLALCVCAANVTRLTALAAGDRELQGFELRAAGSDLESQSGTERRDFCWCSGVPLSALHACA